MTDGGAQESTQTSTQRPQPLLHNAIVVMRAPTQAWSDGRGDMGAQPVHGLYHSNTRVIDTLSFEVEGHTLEQLRAQEDSASLTTFTMLLRGLPGERADPRFRIDRTRRIDGGLLAERIAFVSALPKAVTLTAVLRLHADFTPIHFVKDGMKRHNAEPDEVTTDATGTVARWHDDGVSLAVTAPGATVVQTADGLEFRWAVDVAASGSPQIGWTAELHDEHAVVEAVPGDPGWDLEALPTADQRLLRWAERALTDLEALRVTLHGHDEPFLAAGAPWFLTMFGRDSIWAAEFMLPLDPGLALSTLRALAQLQGERVDPDNAEQPGKILHELRPGVLELPQLSITLPPLYYGTIDATPLWIVLLCKAWHGGVSGHDIKELLPNLKAALAWMRDYGMGDDGFLRYIDESGRGLANQGWKDSDDSIQWHDGRLAEGPIALCEVQGYAYQAAMAGAELLESFGEEGYEEWTQWAAELRARFHERFWISHPDGDYPAVALDAHGAKVDSVASNMGHLLGTGILDREQAELIARRLLSPEMNSEFGLRTMSTADAGYWPLSYHGGSVWAHDTAIAVIGLAREGLRREARELADGLISAAVRFGFRMPELHSGDARHGTEAPLPYPAACRPQAWSAAAAVAIAFALH
ncbi:MAG: amylo-alpha-1,6-glucosidase [Microbacteriaceae bacterium]|nr:amylo-alpha-1,6-glucosidase [Microbacteriaceae bacterium]MCL2793732.1 amylo-alpha-1,6-glucosidase [Microbacteriaceae bacterium]